MPYLLDDLIVDRVDLVDEGANSVAFIEFFKRKEQKKQMEFSEILDLLQPEHAEVVKAAFGKLTDERDAISKSLEEAKAEVGTLTEERDNLSKSLEEAKAEVGTLTEERDNLSKSLEEAEAAKQCEVCECDGEADENGLCVSCGKPKKSASFDETEVLKSMPESMREVFLKMKSQKEAAEEQVRLAAEKEKEAEAVAKAATMKSLPVEQETLVDILKSCDQKVVDVLSAVAAAIDGTVLDEVGKSRDGKVYVDAWDKIEAEADKIVTRDSVTKQKAIGIAIKENPELYREYLKGGTN